MKIIIADDEELVRENLKDVLLGINRGDEICEAVNGRTLVEMVRDIRPDICFVDIRMPGISGLEAIEELAEDFPDISWIILSGYSEFEYARKALGLGVVEYLLKPATETEVSDALNRAAEKRLNAGRLKREKFEYRVGGVLNNSSAAEFDEFLLGHSYYAAIVFIPSGTEQNSLLNQQRNLLRKLRNWLDETPLHDYAGAFNVMDGYPAIIAAGDAPLELLEELEQAFPDELYPADRIIFTPALPGLPQLISFFEHSPEFGDFGTAVPGDDAADKSSHIVRRAEKLVLEQYREPVGLAQIADALNVTPNYLSMLFKKHKQVSFTRFITDIRLKESLSILKTPGVTVKEASQNLGYMSSRHFTRLFRGKYGMTPSEFISRG